MAVGTGRLSQHLKDKFLLSGKGAQLNPNSDSTNPLVTLDKSPTLHSSLQTSVLVVFFASNKMEWKWNCTVPPTQSPCLATTPSQHPAHYSNVEGVQFVFRGREELNLSTAPKHLPLLRISAICSSFFALMFSDLITLPPKTLEVRGFYHIWPQEGSTNPPQNLS